MDVKEEIESYVEMLREGSSDETKEKILNILEDKICLNWKLLYKKKNIILILAEKDDFAHQKLAALVLSKILYYAGYSGHALHWGIQANELFQVSRFDKYTNAITGIKYI